MDVLALVLFFGPVALFALRAWKPNGRFSARDRSGLVASVAVAAAAFAAAPLLINWVRVPAAVWLVAVALLAGGVAGAALRWPELPWLPGTRRVRGAVGAGATLAISGVIAMVAVA